jgi:hypothetical protein
MLAGCLVSLLAIAILAAALRSSNNSAQGTQIESSTADTGLDDSHPADEIFDSSNVSSDRPDYLYSVIPRGAYTEAELRTAMQNDPVVAAHYRQLDQSKLRTEVVARDRYVHVSYRKGNEIFWTKNKVLLRKGETIVTDGSTQVRARCGNCISEQPLLPTAENEPDVVEFDRLVDAVPTPAPQVALVQPVAPSAANRGLGAPEIAAPGSTAGGAPTPLAASRLGAAGIPTPLAASESATPAGGRTSPTPTPSPNPGPGPDVVPPSFVDVPGLPPSDPLDPLVPLDELFPNPPDGPPVYDVPPPGSPGDPPNPTPVPEPGTLILVGGGVAELDRRKKRSRKR